ncbi:MAG: NAD(P)/FAD-dependent oxidoreductase [Thermoplasmata archaeon YP2-bin.285]|uniref:Digeranylgeranylglycerophospholipid reductase n=3 Tax=Candidatus Sysuiplasma superficiale TaxID=2823368 RepID=A0A8J8CBS3_9ARCH|nr:NAD(P)/FAD-dependent oxidoreductase [Candidatus Sysuiplasma superficiale]
MFFRDEYDVIVVGAGPAGSTAARYAAMHGADVLLIEKRQEIGSPVRCGEGVSMEIFRHVDIKPDPSWFVNQVTGARIFGPSGKHLLIDAKNAGDEVGAVIERDAFDKHLATLAARAGAEISTKTSVTALLRDDGAISGVTVRRMGEYHDIRSKLVIGADGFESQVARWAGINTNLKTRDTTSNLQYRMTGLDLDRRFTDFYIGSVAPGGYVWIFPKSDHVANVGIGLLLSRIRGPSEAKDYLDAFIERDSRFRNADILETVSGGVSVSAPLDSVVADGVMLVGDAARMIDPLTGGGISNGVIAGSVCGRVAAEAVAAGDVSSEYLQRYEEGWRGLLEEKLYRDYMAKEKLITLDDETLDKLIDALSSVPMENLSTKEILTAVRMKYPELVAEFEDLI